MPRPAQTRGHGEFQWIESYCLYPNGLLKGQLVRLSSEQKQEVLRIYDNPTIGFQPQPVAAPLAARMCPPISKVMRVRTIARVARSRQGRLGRSGGRASGQKRTRRHRLGGAASPLKADVCGLVQLAVEA